MEYTHIFRERGNGFPQVGDEVIVEDESGWHQIQKVESISRIQTRQWASNWIYLTLTDADCDYDELSESRQDWAYDNLPHVDPIDETETTRRGLIPPPEALP